MTEKSASKSETFCEETYFLSDLLKNGCCATCIKGTCQKPTCQNNKEKRVPFPGRFKNYVQNPKYIKNPIDLGKLIDEQKHDFDDKKCYYTVCNYITQNCNNCLDGRVKYIDYDGKNIALCYPILQPDKFKVTIGVHVDVKLILRGPKYDISFIPLDIPINKQNKKNTEEFSESDLLDQMYCLQSISEGLSLENLSDNLVSTMNPPSVPPSVKKTQSYASLRHTPSFPSSMNLANDEDDSIHFPPLSSNNSSKRASPIKDFSVIKDKFKSVDDRIDNDDYYYSENDYLRDEIQKLVVELNDSQREIKKLKSEDVIVIEMEKLKSEKYDLLFEIRDLKEELNREKIKVKNACGGVYDEILYNIEQVNNRVTEDFLNSEYKDYIVS